MKKNTAILLIVLAFIVSALNVRAEIKMPAIFGDHMVLQQQTDALIWGKASPGKTVKVTTSWNNKSYTARTDNQGAWKLKVSTPVAGGPYSLTISDGTLLTLNNILIGEVWVCSGQSNMQMPMKGFFNQPIVGSNEAIATSANDQIRLFTVKTNKALLPLDDFAGNWMECLPANVSNFSATAYFFGRMLQESLGVPVGLICSAWGGTRIEPWISEAGLKEFDWVKLPARDLAEYNQQTPTVLYNAMIAPMVGYGIRGAIWYQGEANRTQPKEYEKLMTGLVKDWRAMWGLGDISFYYAQIAPYNYGSEYNSAFLREAQLKASTSLPKMGMASLTDAGEEFCIHPANKEAAGERLAYIALADTYGHSGFAFSGPVMKDMTINGNAVNLTFNHAANGLTSYGKELTTFKLAGKDKRFYPAKAVITRTGVTVTSQYVAEPVAVRYAFEDFVVGDLFNSEGLPASSFRSDDWEK